MSVACKSRQLLQKMYLKKKITRITLLYRHLLLPLLQQSVGLILLFTQRASPCGCSFSLRRSTFSWFSQLSSLTLKSKMLHVFSTALWPVSYYLAWFSLRNNLTLLVKHTPTTQNPEGDTKNAWNAPIWGVSKMAVAEEICLSCNFSLLCSGCPVTVTRSRSAEACLLLLSIDSALVFHLTLSTVLKSTPVKTFPTKGRAQGPGGKLFGFQFLTTSIKSNARKIINIHVVKSMDPKMAWKIMVKMCEDIFPLWDFRMQTWLWPS